MPEGAKPIEKNAITNESTAQPNGDVFDTIGAEEGQRQLPATESGTGVPARGQGEALETPPPEEPYRELGPGAANIEEFGPKRTIASYNEGVDQQRAERGLPPGMSEGRQGNEQTWDAAVAKIEQNPDLPRVITDQILSGERKAVNTEDQAALAWRMVDLRNKRDLAADRLLDERLTPEEHAEAANEFHQSELDLQRTEEANRKFGTEWGRTGQFRQRLINDDFTLGPMLGRATVAKGEPLTREEAAAVKATSEKIQKDTAAFGEREAGPAVDESIRQIEAEASAANPEFTPEVKSLADRIVSRLDTAAANALQRLRAKLKVSASGVDPTILSDFAIYGASKITKGLVKFGQWSTEMVREFGDAVKPYLSEAWTMANKHIDDTISGHRPKQPKAVREAVTKENASARADEIGQQMKAEGKPIDQMGGFVRKLAETFVRGGVNKRDALIDAVHGVLKTIDPAITRRKAMDLISGYGDFKPLDKDAVKTELRDLKGQMQQVAKLEDIQTKRSIARTGVERRTPSDEERRLIHEVNEMKKKFPLEVTDPEKQLKSAQSTIETRLKNQIKDLTRELETGEKRTRTPAPTSERIEMLRELRDRVKATLDSLKPKKVYDPLKGLKTRMAKQLADITDRTLKADFGPRPKRTPVDLSKDPVAVKLKADIDRAKAEFNKQKFAWEQARRTRTKKAIDTITDVLGASRSLMTTADVSAPLRQGGFLAIGDLVTAPFNKGRAFRQIGKMFHELASQEGYDKSEASIRLRPNAPIYESAGLDLTDPHGRFTHREENMRSNLAEELKIPWVGKKTENIPGVNLITNPGKVVVASNRAYAGFLNRQRADAFDAMLDMMGGKDRTTPEEQAFLAQAINDMTGRAKVGGKNIGVANWLAKYLFSPRYLLSRFKLLVGAPVLRDLGNPNISAKARAVVALQYGKFALGIAAALGLLKLSGATVELDPRSSDFLKARMGKTTIDLMTGMQQIATFLSRFLTGKTKQRTGEVVSIREPEKKFSDQGFMDIAGNFARSKLAPIPGALVDYGVGTTMDREKVTPLGELQRLTVPISYQDVGKTYREHGPVKGTAIQMLNLLGAGVQNQGK